MALDFMGIASQGVYPTPVPTMARRMALAISQGLLNIGLPGTPESTLISKILNIGRRGIDMTLGLFRLG